MKALVLSVQQSASAGASKDGFAEKSFARYRKKRAVEEFGAIEYRNCQSALACQVNGGVRMPDPPKNMIPS